MEEACSIDGGCREYKHRQRPRRQGESREVEQVGFTRFILFIWFVRKGQGCECILSALSLNSTPNPPSLVLVVLYIHLWSIMAPFVGFDTDHFKDKARKDLLYLLEGVSKEDPPH